MLVIAQARTSLGSSNFGTELGPEAILLNGLLDGLKSNELTHKLLNPVVSQAPQGEKYRNLKNFHELKDFNQELFDLLVANVSAQDQLLTLGGDHAIGIGSMSAAKQIWPDSKIIYIDAHPDCHEKAEHTTSGNIHGLPVSTILGDGLAEYFNFPKFGYEDIFMIGLKDIDKDEAEYLGKHHIAHITMDDIIGSGIGPAVAKIVDWAGDTSIHIGLDIDGIDQGEAPGTGILNHGGLSYREVSYLCRKLSELSIRSIDVVEVNPAKDIENKTVHLATELIMALLGGEWSTYNRYLAYQ